MLRAHVIACVSYNFDFSMYSCFCFSLRYLAISDRVGNVYTCYCVQCHHWLCGTDTQTQIYDISPHRTPETIVAFGVFRHGNRNVLLYSLAVVLISQHFDPPPSV